MRAAANALRSKSIRSGQRISAVRDGVTMTAFPSGLVLIDSSTAHHDSSGGHDRP
jgi:hypothetical protein